MCDDEWMAAMRRGDHDAAWAVSDRVLAARDPALRDDATQPYHCRWVWDGRPLRGRDVLVRCYHGLGDTLQYVRYLPALRAQAASVTLEVQPELFGLLAAADGADRVVAFRQDAPMKADDCDVEIMELGHALRLLPDAVRPPYVHAELGRIGGGVGLCWEAGGWDEARSIPFPLLAPLLAVGRAFVSLHPRPAPAGLLNRDGCPRAIEHTAGFMAGLDLVITVDTMVAHLAGALGLPTWLLLKHDADWRWERADCSRWYPTMRLFRQEAPGDWGPVMSRLARMMPP